MNELAKPESALAAAEHPAPDLKMVPIPADAPPRLSATPDVTNFSDNQMAVATQRKLMLAPMLERPAGTTLGAIATQIAAANGISVATVWRYYSAFKKKNFAGLIPDTPGPSKGELRWFLKRKLATFVRSKWAEGKLNIKRIHEAVVREWGGKKLPYGKKKPPCYATIARHIESWGAIERAFPRCPTQELTARMSYLETRRGVHYGPNDEWIADHAQADVWVWNDVFPEEPLGAPLRLWLTDIIDCSSRLDAGFWWSTAPSWDTIAPALFVGMRRWGKPKRLYCDNGKDFIKAGKPGGLLDELGIEFKTCTKRHPQAKAIEAHFHGLRERFDKLFASGRGYAGRSPETRPDSCVMALKQHKLWLAGRREETPLFSASRFIELHQQSVEEYNRGWKHSGAGMDGRTPLGKFSQLLPPEKRDMPDTAALLPLFWDKRVCVVQRGKVHQFNDSFSAALADARGGRRMMDHGGKEIVVRWMPHDMRQALAFEKAEDGRAGEFIAHLVSDQFTAREPITQQQIKQMMRQRARTKKALKKLYTAAAVGITSEIDHLDRRTRARNVRATNLRVMELPAHTLPQLPERVPEHHCETFVDTDRAAFEAASREAGGNE